MEKSTELNFQRNPYDLVQAVMDSFPLIMRKSNLDVYFREAEKFIEPSIMRRSTLSKVKKLLSLFSCSISNSIGFEVILNEDVKKNDFFIAIPSGKLYRSMFVKLFEKDPFLTFCARSSSWKKIATFAKEWNDPTSSLYAKVMGFWFEFDSNSSREEIPVPCIFFTSFLTGKRDELSWLVEDALSLFDAHFKERSYRREIEKSVLSLPKGSKLFQIGMMLSRPSRDLRLVIKDVDRKSISAYLKRLRWKGDIEGLNRLISSLPSGISRLVLHIAVERGGISDISIECSFEPNRFHREKRWEKILSYLVEKGLCDEKKKKGLLHFPGVSIFPIKLAEDSGLETYFKSMMVRYLSHIKLSYEDGNWKKAKAYLGIRHFLLPAKFFHQTTNVPTMEF